MPLIPVINDYQQNILDLLVQSSENAISFNDTFKQNKQLQSWDWFHPFSYNLPNNQALPTDIWLLDDRANPIADILF